MQVVKNSHCSQTTAAHGLAHFLPMEVHGEGGRRPGEGLTIQLRRGILVCAFGVRITQKACWKNPHHPWNGNYLAFSQDGGRT
jgi:hypothetical protein